MNKNTGSTLQVLGFIMFLVPFFVIPLSMVLMSSTQSTTMFSLAPLAMVFAVIGFFLMVAGTIINRGGAMFQPRIPPGATITIETPSRDGGPIKEIECPGCGAPPDNFNFIGAIECSYCGKRYRPG